MMRVEEIITTSICTVTVTEVISVEQLLYICITYIESGIGVKGVLSENLYQKCFLAKH